MTHEPTTASRPHAIIEQRARQALFAGQPAGLQRLFFTELWERFSYYGMRALLTLFMVAPIAQGGLALSTPDATRIYGNYTMAVYMLSIPGGFIADRILGARRSVLMGGWIIALGHYCLAVPDLATFYAGLILVALGTGLFKPNISGLVGALYHQNDERRDAGFSIFYMGINIGAFIAPLVTGFLAQSATFKGLLASFGFDPASSWHWGFGAAGVGMTVAMLLYMRGQHMLDEPVSLAERFEGKGNLVRDGLAMSALTLTLLALALLSDVPGFEVLRWMFLVLAARRHRLVPDAGRRSLQPSRGHRRVVHRRDDLLCHLRTDGLVHGAVCRSADGQQRARAVLPVVLLAGAQPHLRRSSWRRCSPLPGCVLDRASPRPR